ncbi:SH3 and cysteine-rich domain-containing protein 2-like isoform X2 [Ictalurus furcatus]|uniref:SH3 and cysteine-rich domain-containing protein 2-like isoform X2 n=1 Tax=Ictalurus furcatus TaxID=66913 RepID=UPI0023501FE4|nr:SH3 and cysteine-rich domain-containing protein 2-like isoform X2 [Ictalurus furcatus]
MTENGEKENEPHHRDLQRSPGSGTIRPESKLQKLKRSLSLKSMMRSKSVENFFQRSNMETLPLDSIITTEAPPSITESLFCDCPLTLDRSPSISPNLSLSSRSPSSSPSLSMNSSTPPPPQPRPQKTHCFLEYVFRRPIVCQQCKQMITGNSKQGLRCKTCKLAAHLWCSSELSQQVCNGKSGAFKRNFSSPLLTHEPFTVVKEAPPTQEQGKGAMDPVYEALRYGTSLAQMSRSTFSSISESPCQQSEEGREKLDSESVTEEEHAAESEVASLAESEKSETEDKLSLQPPRRIELRAIHTYVALYKFLPQEKNDLELQPGDRVQVIDDSNEDWWKGKSRDKVGSFPANFVQRVRPGERVWKVTQGFHGNREKGQMTIKELQICVGKAEETDGFYKLTSGKKRGLVPSGCVEEI